MESLIIVLGGNALITIGSGIASLLIHKWHHRKSKKQMAQLMERLDEHERALRPTNEPIPTPSEEGYEQLRPKTNYYA